LREERRLREFKNRVLRRIFGPKSDEVTRECRKLHNEELHNLNSSSQYLSDDKIDKNEMGGACSSYGRGVAYTGFGWGNLRVRDHLGDPGVDGRTILRCIFRKWDVGA
jgi:hypothetical protein